MKILLLLSVLFGVTGCSSIFGVGEKDVNIKTVRVDRNIPIQPWPKPVNMAGINLYVVTENNYEEFKERFMSKNKDFVYVAMSVKDYENLAINVQDVKRYIKQQKEIIIYYEVVAEGTKNTKENQTNE